MIGHQLALIRREIWEHRAIYVTPIAIAVIVSLISLAGMVTVSAFDKEVSVGPNAIVGTGVDMKKPNEDEPERLNTGITIVGKRAVIPASWL